MAQLLSGCVFMLFIASECGFFCNIDPSAPDFLFSLVSHWFSSSCFSFGFPPVALRLLFFPSCSLVSPQFSLFSLFGSFSSVFPSFFSCFSQFPPSFPLLFFGFPLVVLRHLFFTSGSPVFSSFLCLFPFSCLLQFCFGFVCCSLGIGRQSSSSSFSFSWSLFVYCSFGVGRQPSSSSFPFSWWLFICCSFGV